MDKQDSRYVVSPVGVKGLGHMQDTHAKRGGRRGAVLTCFTEFSGP